MARWEVEKVEAAHLLEALRVVLDHLRNVTMNESGLVLTAGRNLSATYAQVRRLRTYVQRSVSACTEIVGLELNEEDQNLFAACAVFELANLDRKLAGPTRPTPDETGWLEERRRTLAQWATSFATRRIENIPVADDSVFLTASVQAVVKEIQRRLVAHGQRSGIHKVTREVAGKIELFKLPPSPTQAVAVPVPPPSAPPTDPDPVAASAARSAAPVPQPGTVVDHDCSFGGRPAQPASVEPSDAEDPCLAGARGFGIPAPGTVPIPARTPAPDASGPGTGLDFDPRRLHDPRVRAIVQLDLRAFERAHHSGDHRLCVVHLGSLLEACCIDYAVAHRREIQLAGPPEGWNLETILRHALGHDLAPNDRSLLTYLNSSRNLLRPAVQLGNPLVITGAAHTELTQFVRRAMGSMGYASAAEPAPAGVSPPLPPVRPGAPVPNWLRGT